MSARILIVEDEALVRTVIFASLTPLGHHLVAVPDGISALARALTHPPDLVISDVMMPGMDGWALVRRVRAHPTLAFVPFIFLSSLASVDDVLRGFRLGADDYLPKPFTPAALVERVTHALQRRGSVESRARGLIGRGAEAPAPPGIRGSLADVGLSSLLVLLEIEKKSGTLELQRAAPPERCRLLLREGRVVQGHVDAGPSQTRADVVYHALAWSQGTFEFRAGEVAVPDEIDISTTGLLMEAARRVDEDRRDGNELIDAFEDSQ